MKFKYFLKLLPSVSLKNGTQSKTKGHIRLKSRIKCKNIATRRFFYKTVA